MGIQEYRTTGGNRALLNEIHRKSDSLAQWQINFISAKEQQVYAFDQIGSGNHGIFDTEEYYPKSGNYDFRYKSVESGQTDRVIVDFGSYPDRDSVIFKDKYGVKLKVVDGNILTFTGVNQADTNFIYAYRGDQKIGKLFLNTYQRKTYKVVLVSVNGATLPDIGTLENYLNKVYRQCVDSFVVETRNLTVSGIENFTHGGTKVAGSVWNASQKTVLEAFGEKYEDNTAYLFFIPKAETNGVAGYMPRYYPYGFIYPGAANRTIAHELGHGIAGLEHPFPESQVSGNTANLMDYRDGTELWHFQWDMLQDPSRKIFKWWQNEEDAQDVSTSKMVCLNDEKALEIINQYRDFYLPDKTNTVVHLDKQNYYASGFIISDDKTEDGVETIGSLAGIRYLGGDYILHYTNVSKEPSVFRYEMSKNQYSTLLNVNDLPKGDNSLAVRVRIDTKSHRLAVERQNSIIQNIELTNNDYTCKQPPAIALPKYYFEVQEVEPTNKDFIVVNDIAKDDIVQRFVNRIENNPQDLIDDNIQDEHLEWEMSSSDDSYKLIIKFIQVNKLSYNQESWQQLAKKVYKQLQIGKTIDIDNKLLITIPYVKVSDNYFYMPGLYYGNKVLFNDKLPNTYKNVSNKNTFTKEDTNEPLIKFLLDVYGNVLKLNELTYSKKHENNFSFDALDNAANRIHKELLDLHNRPNLKKPKLKIWIDEEVLDKDINPNTLKEYIRYAFDNCFEDDNTVDFKLGYDLEFINEPEKNTIDIVACYTIKNKLLCCCKRNYTDDTGCLHGVTYTNPNDGDCPIWLNPAERNSNEYYFLVHILFHEICHRITYRGSLIMNQDYFNHKAVCPSGNDGHDERGLVYGGDNITNKALPMSALKSKGIFYISNSLRRYVMYNYLLHNLKQYNNQ